MTELTGSIVVPANDLAIYDEPRSDAVGHGDVNEISGCVAAALAEPHLGERAGDRSVFDLHRESRRFGEGVAHVHVAPAKLGSVEDATGELIDHSRDDESDPIAF